MFSDPVTDDLISPLIRKAVTVDRPHTITHTNTCTHTDIFIKLLSQITCADALKLMYLFQCVNANSIFQKRLVTIGIYQGFGGFKVSCFIVIYSTKTLQSDIYTALQYEDQISRALINRAFHPLTLTDNMILF